MSENRAGERTKREQGVIAISKIEIALIVVLTLAGFGVWLASEWLVDTGLSLTLPAESAMQAEQQVPIHEAHLAQARSRLEANQSQIDTLAREDEAISVSMALLRDAHPLLPATIADIRAITVPIEPARDFLAARAQLSAAQAISAQLALEITSLITETRDLSNALALQTPDTPDHAALLARRTAIESAIQQAQERYAEQRIVAAEQNATIAAAYAVYPELRDISDTVPADVMLRYLEAGQQRLERQRAGTLLEGKVAALEQAVSERAQALADAETRVARSLAQQTLILGLARGGLLAFLALVIFVILGYWLPGRAEQRDTPGQVEPGFVRRAVIGLLAVLFAYQFSLALALLVLGIGLLLILFGTVMPRRPVSNSHAEASKGAGIPVQGRVGDSS